MPRPLLELREQVAELAASGGSVALNPVVKARFARSQRAAVEAHRDAFSQAQLNQIQAISMLLDRVTNKQLWTPEAQRTAETWKRVRAQARGLLRDM